MKAKSTEIPAIEIVNLSKFYGKSVGIKNLSISIKPGEMYGFLGENGAGKTTTIRLILNILIPDKGIIKVLGTAVNRKATEIKNEIGYLPGELNFPDNYLVKDVLTYISLLRSKPPVKQAELVKRLGLDITKRTKQLSKGNKQKLGIILALMHDPKIIILDEPSSGLDPINQQTLYNILKEEQLGGKTIFFSSHNLEEVQKICDRVAIIQNGELISVEKVTELAKQVPKKLKAKVEKIDEEKLNELKLPYTIINKEQGDLEIDVDFSEKFHQVFDSLSKMKLKDFVYLPASLEEYFLSKYRRN